MQGGFGASPVDEDKLSGGTQFPPINSVPLPGEAEFASSAPPEKMDAMARLSERELALDAPQQPRVRDVGQVRVEGFAEPRVHAARSSRRRIFLRLVSGDFSPA